MIAALAVARGIWRIMAMARMMRSAGSPWNLPDSPDEILPIQGVRGRSDVFNAASAEKSPHFISPASVQILDIRGKDSSYFDHGLHQSHG